jgi:hypothetical protein
VIWGDCFMAAGTVLYMGGSIAYLLQGFFPYALLYLFYAGGNVALLWAAHWRVK